MKLNPKKKKIIIASTALVTAAALGAGIWFSTQGSSEPVGVYPFENVGMTEYWGDNQESYGPVTTDKIQTVFLSQTQTVTEVLVAAGDTVKKGDILMRFDTTLSDLQLERKRLEMEKHKLTLQDAQTELWKIENMEPMVIPDYFPEPEEPDLGTALSGAYQVSSNSLFDGSSPEKALICWIRDDGSISDSLLEAIRRQAETFQNQNALRDPSAASDIPVQTTEATEATTPETTETTVPETTEATVPVTTEVTVPETTESTVPETTEEAVPETTEATVPETTEETVPETTEETVPETTEETIPETTEPEPAEVEEYYVVIKATEGNMSLGARILWQGLHVTGSAESGFRFKFFDAFLVEDHMLVKTEEPEEDEGIPGLIYGSGFTAQQIYEMRKEQQAKIKELERNVKMAETEYKIMQAELKDGNIYSEIDGEVVSLLTEDEAKMNNQPMIKVSGGGGFYMKGSVSELEKDNLKIGQEVTINDWNTGMTYTGEVRTIGDFPDPNGYWNGMGNPNTSYFPFTVFIDGSADLQAGSYVSAMYSTSSGENGIYLENPFLRTEQGNSYVYVLGDNGRLEKRFVTVGKSLWGTYTEIISGLSAEDLIAFPYGKNVKDGAPAVESDISELYNY